MKEFKGTKGEWVADSKLYDFPISSDHKIDVQTNNSVIELNFECSISEEEVLANAKLIAAAPELLEALQMMKSIIDDTPENGLNPIIDTYGNFREKVNKAINKALGE